MAVTPSSPLGFPTSTAVQFWPRSLMARFPWWLKASGSSWHRCRSKVLMIGNTLAIGGVGPAGIDAVLDAGGASHLMRHVTPPVRLLAGPCHVTDGHEQQA